MRKIKLLIKFPVRNRPEKLFSSIDKIYDKLSDKDNYLIAITADKDDATIF